MNEFLQRHHSIHDKLQNDELNKEEQNRLKSYFDVILLKNVKMDKNNYFYNE